MSFRYGRAIDWSVDFQIGALKKPGMIAPIWKSALRGAVRGSMRELPPGRILSPSKGEGRPHPEHFELIRPQRGTKHL